jgi:hypothetical protein
MEKCWLRIFAGCSSCLVLLLASCTTPRTESGERFRPELKADAMFIRNSLDALAFQNPEDFREFVMRHPRSILDDGLYTAATNALAHSIGYRGEELQGYPKGVDAWGVPFWVDIRFVKTGTNALGKKEQVFEINLWSSGPNKRNEQGSGDDILYGPFETEVEKP